MTARKSYAARARDQQISLRQGPSCTVWNTLASMNDADRADLQEALDDLNIHATMITRVLHEDGIDLTEQAIQRHRRSACQCWKFKG